MYFLVEEISQDAACVSTAPLAVSVLPRVPLSGKPSFLQSTLFSKSQSYVEIRYALASTLFKDPGNIESLDMGFFP
jgi:hypothetical protein